MAQRGIYVSPCDIRPNKDMVCTKELSTKEQKLWIIEFKVRNIGKGCAVVKANNPKKAEDILKSEGIYNGMKTLYVITRIEEIIPSLNSMLLAEQLNSFNS